MLTTILTVAGRPGLYRLLTQGKNMLVVEELTTKKRLPVHMRERVSSLGDISMYTLEEDKPLWQVLQAVADGNGAQPVDLKDLEKKGLREEFAKYVPDFDRDRVHTSDIRRLFQWYNILVNAGITDFRPQQADHEAEAAEAEAPEA